MYLSCLLRIYIIQISHKRKRDFWVVFKGRECFLFALFKLDKCIKSPCVNCPINYYRKDTVLKRQILERQTAEKTNSCKYKSPTKTNSWKGKLLKTQAQLLKADKLLRRQTPEKIKTPEKTSSWEDKLPRRQTPANTNSL